MSAPSWQDIYDTGMYVLQARRPKLVVNQGDVTDAFLAGVASMVDVALAEAAAEFLATYLDGAQGDDLTNLAHDRGVDRDPGDNSVGSVKFSRVGAGVGAGTIPAGFLAGSVADRNGSFASFITNVDTVFGGADLTKTVNATCTAIGPGGNVAAGTVTRMLASAFDPSITVTNPVLFAGGGDQESDPDLRDRVRGFFLTQAKATIDAIAFGAKTVSGVSRVTVVVDPSTGIITVYVADQFGNSNAAMIAAVTAIMPQWAGADSIVNVIGGVIFVQVINLSLTVKQGTDVSSLLDAVRKSVLSAVGRLVPGDGAGLGTLYRDAISTAAKDVDRNNIVSCQVNVPATNIQPVSGQIIRTTLNVITFS